MQTGPEALTISDLERETGVSRSTIHFYLEEGLLPKPQKTAASRSLYSEAHVRLLRKIGELKRTGHSLADIRVALGSDLIRAQDRDVDLAAQEYERVHRAILRVATEEFAAKGYKGTHVKGIIRKLGITSQVFYGHFPSKLQLLVESFQTFINWNMAYYEPKVMESPDLGERLLWRLFADFRANRFGGDVVLQLLSEGPNRNTAEQRLTEHAWEAIVERMKVDFESVRAPGAPPPSLSLELLGYSMIGANHIASMRAQWDEQFTRADLLQAHLWIWLAVLAALSGEVDIDSRVARYKDLIQDLASREPENPPAPED